MHVRMDFLPHYGRGKQEAGAGREEISGFLHVKITVGIETEMN